MQVKLHSLWYYDILTAQPAVEAKQIQRKQMKMAMSVGNNRHYRFDEIHGRHFVQTAMRAGLSRKHAIAILNEMAERTPQALDTAMAALPTDFPPAVPEAVQKAVMERVRSLRVER